MKTIKDCTELSNGVKMPWVGFGVYLLEDGQVVNQSVLKALEVGYRSIDTASFYKNEKGVGQAIANSGIPREEVFLTTKVWNDDLRRKRVEAAFEESLELLGTTYLDLYLIHWPVEGCYLEAWKAMERLYKSGRARAIGVSNFTIKHLKELSAMCDVQPMVNQVEFHPELIQTELRNFCQANGIQYEAWSPLMQGRVTELPALKMLAEKYSKTTAQVVLRWNLQHQVVTIPKSAKAHRIVENAQLYDFELSQADMMLLDELDQGKRIGPDPNNFDF